MSRRRRDVLALANVIEAIVVASAPGSAKLGVLTNVHVNVNAKGGGIGIGDVSVAKEIAARRTIMKKNVPVIVKVQDAMVPMLGVVEAAAAAGAKADAIATLKILIGRFANA